MGESSMMTEYYKEMLEIGLEYQDFISDLLLKELGFPLSVYSSKKKQLTGENKQGIEIKYDRNMEKTGNFYIEVSEKSSENIKDFTASGIYREDNTWLFLIGNYQSVYIFSIKGLRRLYKSGDYKIVTTKDRKTSNGFLLPVLDAEKYCLKKIKIGKGEYADNKS